MACDNGDASDSDRDVKVIRMRMRVLHIRTNLKWQWIISITSMVHMYKEEGRKSTTGKGQDLATFNRHLQHQEGAA